MLKRTTLLLQFREKLVHILSLVLQQSAASVDYIVPEIDQNSCFHTY